MTGRRHFGSVRKRPGGLWQALYWHEGRRHSEGSFLSKADALAFLATAEADIRRGSWIDSKSGKITLDAYSNDWLAHRSGLSIRTVELYEYLLNNHFVPAFGQLALSAVSASKVRNWNADLAGRSLSTASRAYRLLSAIFKTAVMDGLITTSPCKVSGAGVEHPSERPMATAAEVEAIASAMPDYLRIVVLLATWCQLRRGEVLGLRRSDVDVMHGSIQIEQSRTFTRNGNSLIKRPKTRAGRRVLSVPEGKMKELVRHLENFSGGSPNALVVVDGRGSPPSATVLQRAWARARAEVGRQDLLTIFVTQV
jgi:integrase